MGSSRSASRTFRSEQQSEGGGAAGSRPPCISGRWPAVARQGGLRGSLGKPHSGRVRAGVRCPTRDGGRRVPLSAEAASYGDWVISAADDVTTRVRRQSGGG